MFPTVQKFLGLFQFFFVKFGTLHILGFFDIVQIWNLSFIEGWDNDFDTVIQR